MRILFQKLFPKRLHKYWKKIEKKFFDTELILITDKFIYSKSYKLLSNYWHVLCVDNYEKLRVYGFEKYGSNIATNYFTFKYADENMISDTLLDAKTDFASSKINFSKKQNNFSSSESSKYNYLFSMLYWQWFSYLVLIISGGHTDLVLMKDYDSFVMLGQTRDDAVGEAFDKVSRILGLGYPGGPIIENWAKKSVAKNYTLPRSWLKDNSEFSFSGLKTATKNLAQQKIYDRELSDDQIALEISEISNAFQESVLDVLMTKSVQVANQFNCETILVSGGVAANGYLRNNFENNNDINAIFPERKYCTDNGIMIACRGLIDFRNKSFRSPESIKVNPQLNIT